MALVPNPDGGALGLGGAPEILGQIDDLLVRGSNNVVPAITVYARETTYDVPFQFTVAKTSWQGGAWRVYAADLAAWIQQIAQHAHVTGVYGAQDTAPNGLLRDILVVTVGTDDGSSAVSVDLPYGLRDSPAGYALIDSTWATLAANGNLTG